MTPPHSLVCIDHAQFRPLSEKKSTATSSIVCCHASLFAQPGVISGSRSIFRRSVGKKNSPRLIAHTHSSNIAMNVSREICSNSSGRSLSVATTEESKAESSMTNRIKTFLRSSPPGADEVGSHDVGAQQQAEVDKQCLVDGIDSSSAALPFTQDRKQQTSGSISRIMAAQDWDRFRMLLSTEVGQIAVQNQLSSSNDFAAESALAYASRFHPPMDVIRCIADLLPPDVAARPDPMNRSPLHVAAKWGAPPRVVRYLAEMDPAAAATQDVHGKTPLHYAAEFYGSNYAPRRSDDKPHKEAVLEVIRYLCKLSPTTVNIEDNDECTALEYAIQNDSDIKVVRSLQKACERDWKKRRSAGGIKQKHADVKQTMLVQQQQRSQRRLDMNAAADMRQQMQIQMQMQQQQLAARTSAEPPKKARKRGSNLCSIPSNSTVMQTNKTTTSTNGTSLAVGTIPSTTSSSPTTTDTRKLLQQGKRRSSRKSNASNGDVPVDMDIAEVSKALQALGQEPKQADDPSTGSSRKVPLGRGAGRKGNSTRALMA